MGLWWGAVVGVVGLAVLWQFKWNSGEVKAELPFEVVPVARCMFGKGSAREFVREWDVPCVLDDSVELVGRWKALQAWNNVEQLAASASTWRMYCNPPSKGGMFGPHYDESRVLATLDAVKQPADHYEVVDVNASQLVERVTRLPKKGVEGMCFFTGNMADVMQVSRYNLLADLEGFETFEVDPESKRQNINLWIGAAGQKTHLHYDSYENFNVQVSGTKIWTLLGPEAESIVKPYPFLHPSHAQSRVPALEALNVTKDVRVYRATLTPGQVLFVPALWWHHVQAVSLSVSVNFWSLSEQSHVAHPAFGQMDALRGKMGDDRDTRAAFAKALIERIVDETHVLAGIDEDDQEGGASSFVKSLHTARYQGLNLGAPIHDAAVQTACTKGSPSTREQVRSFKEARAAINQLLLLPARVRDVWISNLVEYVAAIWLSPQLVEPFLRLCFT